MAKGTADYYRGVDIAYQALSQVIVRPKYGGVQIRSGQVAVGANQGTTLVSVLGKGMLYGGALWLDYTLTQAQGLPTLVFDNDVAIGLTFVRLNDYGMFHPGSFPITLNRYDSVNHIYSVSLGYGITFEEHIALMYVEQNGLTPTVHFRLVYALI